MRLTATAVGASLVVALIAVTWAAGARRAVSRRVAVLGERVGARLPARREGNLEPVLSGVERAVEATRRRADDSALAAERLAAALAQVSEGVVVCDASGEVVYRNGPSEDYLGTRHAEAIAAEAVTAHLAAALAGEPGSRTLDLFGPPRRTLTVHAAPLGDPARPIGAVAVVEDVSERRRLEAVRRDFVANISHELTTPVGALGLLAETMAGEDDPATVRRFALRMQHESHRVGRIIDDLLDLSRIEAEGHPQREVLRMNLLVAEAADRARLLADRRQITVDVGPGPAGAYVEGDRRQLVSALLNLLENAVKYSDDGSVVSVAVGLVEGHVEVSVTDQGIGIPARDLERIFERFYRVDRARARDTGGTGLGLAIVRHVSGNHGGEVSVRSQEGQGSTFTLRLPAVAAGATSPAPLEAV